MFTFAKTFQTESDVLRQEFFDMADEEKFNLVKRLYEENKIFSQDNKSLLDRVNDKQFLIDNLLKVIKYQNGLND